MGRKEGRMNTKVLLDFSDIRILLLDDSKAFIGGMKSILSESKFQVSSHISGIEALTELRNSAFDIIITDLEMPEMHGFEFVKKVREELGLKHTPILVLTGSYDVEAMAESIRSGADAFCLKETVLQTIFPQVLALLRLKSTYEEAIKGKQLDAVQSLIGTYKHEFGNSLAIMDGMVRKLGRNLPSTLDDPAMKIMQQTIDRFQVTLQKLSELRSYEEEKYSQGTKILKVG